MSDQIDMNVFLTVLGLIFGLVTAGAVILLLKLFWNIFKFFWEELSDW